MIQDEEEPTASRYHHHHHDDGCCIINKRVLRSIQNQHMCLGMYLFYHNMVPGTGTGTQLVPSEKRSPRFHLTNHVILSLCVTLFYKMNYSIHSL